MCIRDREQARAVVCFDNRVQVVASAGSGKTSTMVAKAAYALHRGLVAVSYTHLDVYKRQHYRVRGPSGVTTKTRRQPARRTEI